MAEIIPKEKLAAFQRWQVGSFDRPGPSTGPAPAPMPTIETLVEPREPAAANSLPTAEELERIYDEAQNTGYAAGFEKGREAAEQAEHAAAEARALDFAARLDNLQQAIAGLEQNVAESLLALATEIAAQVIGGAFSLKKDFLLPIIREAIAALPLHHGHITLRLHPLDAQEIKPLVGEQLAQNSVQILEDGEISPGGCIIRAGTSEVDASIETRWKRVLEAIGTEPRAWLNK